MKISGETFKKLTFQKIFLILHKNLKLSYFHSENIIQPHTYTVTDLEKVLKYLIQGSAGGLHIKKAHL
jgi:hypothetical protein